MGPISCFHAANSLPCVLLDCELLGFRLSVLCLYVHKYLLNAKIVILALESPIIFLAINLCNCTSAVDRDRV